MTLFPVYIACIIPWSLISFIEISLRGRRSKTIIVILNWRNGSSAGLK